MTSYLIEFRFSGYAKKGVLIVAKRTKIPLGVREYARLSNVKITKMSTMKKTKKRGFWDW